MKTMKKATSGLQNAFTLVELMVGMALAGIIFTGAFSGMKTGFDIVEESRDQARVTQLLQSEIERMRTLNWTDLKSLPANATITLDGALAQAYAERYTFTRNITQTSADQIEVEVVASWKNGNRNRSLSMFTGFTQNGLYDYYYRAF